MQHSQDKRLLADHKVSELWPRRFTMLWHLCQSTLSKPHQIQWVWIHFCCSSNWLLWGTDVFKYELCVYPPALCEATGTVLQSDIPSQANAIQGWVHPSSTQIPQDDSYIYNGNVLIQKISMENRADYWVTEHFKKEIWPTKVISVWCLPRWSLYKDNCHLRWRKLSGSNSPYSKEAL